MNYSILSYNVRLCFNDNIESTYVDWIVKKGFTLTYQTYRHNYKVMHDVIIFDVSLFGLLCNVFSATSNKFQIPNISKFIEELKKVVLYNRNHFYNNLYREAYEQLTPIEHIPIEDLITEEYDLCDSKSMDVNSILLDDKAFFNHLEQNDYPYDEIAKYAKNLAQRDSNSVENIFIEKKYEIKTLLEEFKLFILGFIEAIQQNELKDFNKFKFCYNHLFKDIQFFRNSHIHSLSKYKFVIGSIVEKNVGKRGKTDHFVPAGTCTYGEKIFINSNNLNYGRGILDIKRGLTSIFYHEVGHALDFVYFNDKVLKNKTNLQRSSYNEHLLKICKNNYKKFKPISSKLPKKYKLWLGYYILPHKTYGNHKLINLEKEFSTIFEDIKPQKQSVYKPYNDFNTNIYSNHVTYNYSKPLIETWAESFSIILDWIKNGFNEQDKMALQKGRSPYRTLIQLQHDSLIYMLNNFDWSLLNISYNMYLKRKRQILQYLNTIQDIPLSMNHRRKRTILRQKFTTHKALLKNILS